MREKYENRSREWEKESPERREGGFDKKRGKKKSPHRKA